VDSFNKRDVFVKKRTIKKKNGILRLLVTIAIPPPASWNITIQNIFPIALPNCALPA